MLTSQDPAELRRFLNCVGAVAFVIDIDEDGAYWLMAVNERYEQLTGLKHDQLAGQRIDTLFDRDTVKQVSQNYDRCIREGTTIDYEETLEMPVGKTHWRTTLVPISNDQHRIYRLFGTAYEISDTVGLRLETRYQSTLLSAYLEESPDGILVVDASNQIKSWNRRFLEIWHIPEPVMESGDGYGALEAVRRQLKKPDEFVRRILYLYKHLDEEERGYPVHLLDNRILERYSRGLLDGTGRYWGRIWFYRDVTERERLNEELYRLARTDPLTDTANRRAFMEQLEEEAERSQRYAHPLSVLMLDVDHFKAINDRLGHEAGDRALRSLADTIRPQLRDSDLLARIGGEEFAVLLPETGLSTAAALAERLRENIASVRVKEDGSSFNMTVSIGVAQLTEPDQAESMLRCADRALYAAKRSGRNRVIRYNAQEHESLAVD